MSWSGWPTGTRRIITKKDRTKIPKDRKKGKMRVIRGGSWYTDDPWDLDAADRQRVVPDFWDDDIGFRCAKNAR